MAGDPFFNETVYLNHWDGIDSATVSPDESDSEHTTTFVGSCDLTTSIKLFGTAALDLTFIGGDWVESPDSDDWDFGSGQFTIETSFRREDQFVNAIMSQWDFDSPGDNSWYFSSDDSVFTFRWSTTGSDTFSLATSGATFPTNTWAQIAVDRDASDVIRIYVDGVMRAKTTSSATFHPSSLVMRVGASDVGSDSNLDGWIDETRITKGVARYASDSGYTVATSAFSNFQAAPPLMVINSL